MPAPPPYVSCAVPAAVSCGSRSRPSAPAAPSHSHLFVVAIPASRSRHRVWRASCAAAAPSAAPPPTDVVPRGAVPSAVPPTLPPAGSFPPPAGTLSPAETPAEAATRLLDSLLPETFGLQCPPASQHTVDACFASALCLLFPVTTLGEMTVIAHSDGHTVLSSGPPRLPGSHLSQEQRAQGLMSVVFGVSSALVFPVGWAGGHRVRVLAAPLPFAPRERMVVRTAAQRLRVHLRKPGFYFMLISALFGGTAYDGAATAYARASSFRQSYVSVADSALAGEVLVSALRFRFGAKEVTSVARGTDPSTCQVGSLLELTLRSFAAEAQLRSTLFAFSSPADPREQAYIHEWAAQVQAFDPTEVPEGACRDLPTLQQQSLLDVPFSHPTPLLATSWLDRKPRQVCSACRSVRHCAQLLLPTCRCAGLLDEWWANATSDFKELAAGRSLQVRHTQTIAIGQNCFRPCARGCVWDCRLSNQVVPLDYWAEIDSGVELALNRKALVAGMEHWPDQELRSHLQHGVRFGADLPLQLVLTPQLKSLAFAFAKTQSELRDLVDRGWYAIFDHIPFMPSRMHPKGATARKLEDRPRPTTDGSHPHSSMNIVDTAGLPVVSLNDAIRSGVYGPHPPRLQPDSSEARHYLPSMPSWWQGYATWAHASDRVPKEYKPTLRAVAQDAAILAYPARCAPLQPHQPVFVMVDDFRNYFSQVPVASEDLWKTVVAGYSTSR